MILASGVHLREARRRYGGYCARGVDAWFTKHKLDLRHFLRLGYPVEVLEATNDLLGQQVAAIAREQAQ